MNRLSGNKLQSVACACQQKIASESAKKNWWSCEGVWSWSLNRIGIRGTNQPRSSARSLRRIAGTSGVGCEQSLLSWNGWIVKVRRKVRPDTDALRVHLLPHHVLTIVLDHHRPIGNCVLLEPLFELGVPFGVEADAPAGRWNHRVIDSLDLSAVRVVPADQLLPGLLSNYFEWNACLRKRLLEALLVIDPAEGSAVVNRPRFVSADRHKRLIDPGSSTYPGAPEPSHGSLRYSKRWYRR
jgi:hypothetical protein